MTANKALAPSVTTSQNLSHIHKLKHSISQQLINRLNLVTPVSGGGNPPLCVTLHPQRPAGPVVATGATPLSQQPLTTNQEPTWTGAQVDLSQPGGFWVPGCTGVFSAVSTKTHMNVDVAMATVNNLQNCGWKPAKLRPGAIWLL